MTFLKSILAVLILVPLTLFADAQKDKTDAVATLLEQRLPSIQVDYIAPSAIAGLYEVMASGQLMYVSEDGNHLFNGRLFDISNGIVNLSEQTTSRIDSLKNPMRQGKIAGVSEDDMIIFKAKDEKYRISVFTDVDCGYCRQLHRNMNAYNDLGISVQYLGYPRAGIGSPSHAKLRSIWCAEDPKAAMDMGKLKREFGTNTCDDPLIDHMQLVRDFGISGTPAIILSTGKLLPGFVQPAQLLQVIEQEQARAATEAVAQDTASGS